MMVYDGTVGYVDRGDKMRFDTTRLFHGPCTSDAITDHVNLVKVRSDCSMHNISQKNNDT